MGAKYYPFLSGRYEVAAGLRPFGTDFSNGVLDQKVFQIDEEFSRFRENKESCRRENIHKYACFHNFTSYQQVNRFLIDKLCEEYSESFVSKGEGRLECFLTQEELHFDREMNLLPSSRTTEPYLNLFDALCSQVQEDVAVIQLGESGLDYLSAIHLCAAGHWAPGDKIGKSFFQTHTPIPHSERINDKAKQFVETMILKGPYVRFVWGFATDKRLNHHPLAPEGISQKEWHGRSFQSPEQDKLYVRVERQVTWGLPQVNSALFFIRVSYLEGEEVRQDALQRQKLREAIESMSPASRVYKGVDKSFDALMDYLKD